MKRVEEQDLFGTPGCNVRVKVLKDDGKTAKVMVDDCGIYARQGNIHTVASSALNEGRK